MRRLAYLLAYALAWLATPTAEARLFWQTYGSTVATADGGCAWNQNQDYFVPRHCDSGRYDLFSPCKASRYKSPACVRLHPIYDGYCTPYTGWHYLRRDHVYAKRCGCTPLKNYYGPWKLERCKKHCFALRDAGCSCDDWVPSGGDGQCLGIASADWTPATPNCEPRGVDSCYGWLANVEPLGGETLGYIPALPMGAGGGAAGGALGAMPGGPAPAMPAAPGLIGLPLKIPGF